MAKLIPTTNDGWDHSTAWGVPVEEKGALYARPAMTLVRHTSRSGLTGKYWAIEEGAVKVLRADAAAVMAVKRYMDECMFGEEFCGEPDGYFGDFSHGAEWNRAHPDSKYLLMQISKDLYPLVMRWVQFRRYGGSIPARRDSVVQFAYHAVRKASKLPVVQGVTYYTRSEVLGMAAYGEPGAYSIDVDEEDYIEVKYLPDGSEGCQYVQDIDKNVFVKIPL